MSALLQVAGLGVVYRGGARPLVALEDVSFALDAGESLGIVGESGSGKSTLARAILGLVPPSTGAVSWRGEPITGRDRRALGAVRRELSVVFQNPATSLSPRRTVAQSVAEPLELHEPALGRSEVAMRVAAMLERVGLSSALGARRPHELSGGQCQRVALARAMITTPKLVICDEPVSALDVSVQAQIVNLLRELGRDTGCGYLFISHNLAVVRQMATRALVLYRGRLIEDAPGESLYRAPRHPYARLLIETAPAFGRAPAALAPPETASPFERAAGCGFAARCRHAEAACRAQPPALEAADDGHRVACRRWREGVARVDFGTSLA